MPFSLFICFKVVQEYERAVIFRLGRLLSGGAKGPGIFFILPCIDTYARVDLRTRTYDIPPQEVLTKDSVTVSVDAVVYYRVHNATISIANVENAHHSTRLLAQTTLRNTMGTRPLHEILSERETISGTMQLSLDEATEAWGIKVERVEIKDVRLPVQLQRAMAAEAEAAREARAKVIAAEGEQKASRALREASEVIGDSPAALQLRYLQTLNRDPWGRPYRMVRDKLRTWAPPLTQSLRPEIVEEVVGALFPRLWRGFTPPSMTPPPAVPNVGHSDDDDDIVPEVTEAEMRAAVRRMGAKNTAPGPDGLHGKAWVLASEALGPRLLGLYSACLERGQFPLQWKTGKLVLVKKPGRPADSPSAYRPIVLLDEVGKVFERIISNRLVAHLSGFGPDLADGQFGFRRGRSTVDAIMRVRDLTTGNAVSRGKVVVAVSLDIANAFNSLPWSCILEALRYHRVPTYLRRVIEAYLTDRFVTYPGHQGEWNRREMSRGVPQGSVLGPLLWNIGYDWVLRTDLPNGVSVVCYADDTLVLAHGRSHQAAANLMARAVATVVARIRQLGLEVALHKSEAMCFHGRGNAPPPDGSQITAGGVTIGVETTMKYLGLVLDSRWNFVEHFRRLAPKLERTGAALKRLLPNLGGQMPPAGGCTRGSCGPWPSTAPLCGRRT
ncbi:retrovirus-related Pol polyprotein from type-1 retrotransposable element R1 isoform X2 [Spodoptera frugiperda]|nr:retrovirus-related Pol polyprotein from type-1 retrotransposable element R1 isoform X2 [Spodoptera frugiperda]